MRWIGSAIAIDDEYLVIEAENGNRITVKLTQELRGQLIALLMVGFEL